MEVREPSAKYLVQPAYKQTEVGMVPDDWEVRQIGDFQPFVTSGSRGWAAYYSEVGSPFIRITNLSRECIYPDLSDLRFVAIPKGDTEGDRTQLEDGDVLISITADIGIVGYVTNQIPKPAYINQHVALVRFDPSQTCPCFISYFLASSSSQKLFRAQTDSGAKAGMNLVTVKRIWVALPQAVAEQQAIAETLSDTDALIESLAQLLAKKRQIKQGAMQELLTGQKRLPGFVGEWEVKQLGEIADTDPENLASNTQADFSFNYISLEDVDEGRLCGYSEQVFCTSPSRARRKLRKHDVLVSTVRPNLLSHLLFPIDGDNWICSTGFCAVRSKRGVSHYGYIYAHMFAGIVNRQIEGLLTGSNYPAINSGDVRGLLIPTPPTYEEQEAIATVLSDMDAEIAALEAELAKARNLKQGMMRELLTGHIRLVQPSAEIIPFPVQVDTEPEKSRPHNRQIEEAVMLGVLAKAFGSEQHPLARVRRTKLLYLLHRHVDGSADGYLKKAAGPYNPKTRYQGPEGIALKNGYVRLHHNGTYEGFVVGDKIAGAEAYFDKWHEPAVRLWLEQFHYTKTEELELLATVDMAAEELRREGNPVALAAVKRIIESDPEWQAKLKREIFSDANIECAITKCHNLFGH